MKQIIVIIFPLVFMTACDFNEEEKSSAKWTAYTMNNSALINNYVFCVAADANDHIWAGNFYGGLTQFDGTEWTHHVTIDSGPFNNSIYALTTGPQNTIWAASEMGLFHLKNGAWTYYISPVFSYWNISDVAIAGDNSIWICNPAVSRLDLGSDLDPMVEWTTLNYSATQIAVAGNGDVWMCNYTGLTRFSGETFTTYTSSNSGLPQNGMSTLAIDRFNRICVGTQNNGLVRYNGASWNIYDTTNSGLPSNRIQTIAYDREHHLWVGTDLGIAYYDDEKWIVYNTENSGLTSNNITGITFDLRNNVWIATYGGGLNVFDRN